MLSKDKTMFLTIIISFSAGFLAGCFFREIAFENQNWMVMKWSSDVLGFRPVMIGARLFKEDKVAMSLEVDTSAFPEEGLIVE